MQHLAPVIEAVSDASPDLDDIDDLFPENNTASSVSLAGEDLLFLNDNEIEFYNDMGPILIMTMLNFSKPKFSSNVTF